MAKIALVGTHGGGKTTLGRRLATTISTDLITEKARLAAKVLGFDSPSKVPFDRKWTYQWEGLILQIAAQERNSSFVSDRSTVDYAAYWTLAEFQQAKGSAPGARQYLEVCMRHAMEYDALILVPKNPNGAEEDGGRFTMHVEEVDEWIRKYLEAWDLMDKVYEVKTDGPENRLAEVLAHLSMRGIVL